MSDKLKIKRSKNMDQLMRQLTDGTFRQMTGDKVPSLTKPQAAALLGNYIHETGSPDLSNLDAVEKGSGAGRGPAQYTGPRRQAYDNYMRGKNPNDPKTQLQYMADEYVGRHDPNGASLIGYTRALENLPKDAPAATKHLLMNYFAPADPGASRDQRVRNAQAVQQLYPDKPKPKLNQKPAPQNGIGGLLRNALSIMGQVGRFPQL